MYHAKRYKQKPAIICQKIKLIFSILTIWYLLIYQKRTITKKTNIILLPTNKFKLQFANTLAEQYIQW